MRNMNNRQALANRGRSVKQTRPQFNLNQGGKRVNLSRRTKP